MIRQVEKLHELLLKEKASRLFIVLIRKFQVKSHSFQIFESEVHFGDTNSSAWRNTHYLRFLRAVLETPG